MPLFCGVCWLILAAISCSSDKEAAPPTLTLSQPDEESEGIRIVSAMNDSIEYIVEAVRMKRYYETKRVMADSVVLRTYNARGEVTSRLSCDIAEIDEVGNILMARQNAMIVNQAGDTLRADFMQWDRGRDILFARSRVYVRRKDDRMTADSLRWNRPEDIIVASGNVFIRKDDERGTLQTDYMEYFRSRDLIRAQGRVILTRQNNVTRGFGLKTDSAFNDVRLYNASSEGVIRTDEAKQVFDE